MIRSDLTQLCRDAMLMARGSNLQSPASVRGNGSSGGSVSPATTAGNLSSKPS